MKSDLNLMNKIRLFFDDTDIYALVYVPTTISFPIYVGLIFLIEKISEKPVPESFLGIGLGIVSFLSCIGGIAQIYKKEIPWGYGKVYKGNFAIVSGIIIVFLFGLGGITAMIMGFNSLFIEIAAVR